MKKTKLYSWMLFGLGLALTACSNLDESAFVQQTDESIIYSEPFATTKGKFIAKSVLGEQTWTQDPSRGYIGITGYVNSVNQANEDWLVSPVIDLTSIAAANLSFDYVMHRGNFSTDASVWVSENYSNDSLPASATWVELKTNIISDPGNYVFSNSGELSLTAFAGEKIRVAIRFLSSATNSGTLELKNFLVKKGEAAIEEKVLFSDYLASSIGTFTQQSVTGAQIWAFSGSYSCMVASGYANGVRNANEDWLISPEIDLTNVTSAYCSFEHSGQYFGNATSEATLWVSDNYSAGLPSTATWTQVTILNYFTSFTFVSTGKLDLNSFAGKKIHVAMKYISTTAVAGTWELRNFKVYEGQAGGAEAKPLTISEASMYQSGGTAWVQGYIVGYSWPYLSQYAYYLSADTCTQKVNVLLADTNQNVYSSKCLSVQLPRGAIRNNLSLVSNKGVFGKKLKIFGTLSTNTGIAGLISPTKYTLSDGTSGTATPLTTYFSETFAANLGAFTQTSVVGAQTWKWSSGFGATMSGFSGGNIANEDWLISPTIDLTTLSSAAMSFDHTINKGVVANMKSEQTLWVSTDDGATWKSLSIATFPAGNNWTFVNSGEIDLDAYAGKKIKLAFKYICTTSSSATWEIKNLKIYY